MDITVNRNTDEASDELLLARAAAALYAARLAPLDVAEAVLRGRARAAEAVTLARLAEAGV